jgi:hypothetical protein
LPARFRSAAVLSLHNIHHPGVRASRRLVCASFCWPKMGSFVSALIRNCLQCQKSKIHRHVTLQAAHIPVPVRRFSHIHVDLVGPLPRSSGFSYLFTVAGQKQFLSLLPPPPTAQPPSYRAGSRGLEFQTSLLVTGGLNSHLHYGRASVLFSPSLTLRRPPTTPNPTASWSGSTAVSRTVSAPGRPERIGFYTSLGYC